MTTQERLEDIRAEIQQMRDRVKLKLHLASMELRDQFEELQPEMDAFERRAEGVTEDVGEELREGGQHLRKALRRILDELKGDAG